MSLPTKVTDVPVRRYYNDDDLCMECGGPSVVQHVPNDGDMFYEVEGSPFCSIDCIERWHGIVLDNR